MDAAITVDTNALVCANVGFSMCSRSHRDAVQRGVIQDDDRVGVQRETLQGEKRVVGLHHDVGRLVLVGKHENNACTSFLPYLSLSASRR